MNLEQFVPKLIPQPHIKLFKSVIQFNDHGLSFFEKCLYCVLFDLLAGGDNTLPTPPVLCLHLGVAPKTVQRGLLKLQRKGLLSISRDKSPSGYARRAFSLKNFNTPHV